MVTSKNKITVDDIVKARKILEENKIPLDDKVILLRESQVSYIMKQLTDYEILKDKYKLLLKDYAELKGGIINDR